MRDSLYDHRDIPADATLSVLGQKSFSMKCGKLIQNLKMPNIRLQPRKNSQELVADLQNGGYVLFPFQNFSSNEVDEYLELMLDTPNLRVVGDAMLEVRMAAIGTMNCDLNNVRKLQSHPQGLRQCTRFARKMLPKREKTILTDTTDQAVLTIGDDDTALALASEDCIPEGSGLRVVKDGVSNRELDGKQNATHFLLMHSNGEQKDLQANRWRHLGIITPPDRRGSLAQVTDIISKNGGNMFVLLSRPIGLEQHTFIAGIESAEDMSADYERMQAQLKEIGSVEDGVPVLQSLGSWNTHIWDPTLRPPRTTKE
jgi:prephenate dehydratase